MIPRILIMCAALVLGTLGDISGAAAQACVIQTPRYSLKADTVDWTMKIASGKSCVRAVRFGNVQLESIKVVSPPKSGQVTLEGPGFRYTSKAKYNGSDFVALSVVGTLNKHPGSSTIRITVSVGESTATRDVIFPSVAFVTPSNDSTVSGSVTLTAAVSDDVAVANVRFLLTAWSSDLQLLRLRTQLNGTAPECLTVRTSLMRSPKTRLATLRLPRSMSWSRISGHESKGRAEGKPKREAPTFAN
jgi:hypothetical protein